MRELSGLVKNSKKFSGRAEVEEVIKEMIDSGSLALRGKTSVQGGVK